MCLPVRDLFNILQTKLNFKLIFTSNIKHMLLNKKLHIFYSEKSRVKNHMKFIQLLM